MQFVHKMGLPCSLEGCWRNWDLHVNGDRKGLLGRRRSGWCGRGGRFSALECKWERFASLAEFADQFGPVSVQRAVKDAVDRFQLQSHRFAVDCDSIDRYGRSLIEAVDLSSVTRVRFRHGQSKPQFCTARFERALPQTLETLSTCLPKNLARQPCQHQ